MGNKTLNPAKLLKENLFTNNPVLTQLLGLCPALAVTSSVFNGFGLGISTMVVMMGASTVVSLLRKFIPSNVRIPCFIVIIASFVTIVQFLLAAFVPALNNALGIFIPLITVNCVVLARAEAFASKNKPIASAIDALFTGVGFTFALSLIGGIRELLGFGTLLGYQVLPNVIPQTLIFILPPGAFFTMAFIVAFMAYRKNKKEAN